MTLEEFDAWMLDTSDAPKPGDPIPEDNNQGNQGNQGNTGGNQGNTGGNHGGLTDEQYQELLKIMDSLGGADPGDPRYNDGGGTGGNLSDDYVSPGINWN